MRTSWARVMRPVRSLSLAAVVALAVSGCTSSGGAEPRSTLDERAEWSSLSLPTSAELAGDRVAFAAALGTDGDLPRLIAGVGAEPGQPDHARAWTQDVDGGWNWKDLPVPADRHGAVSFAVTDGDRTWIGGRTWTAGAPVEPFVVSSTDRQDWEGVELPDEAADLGFVPAAAAPADGGLLVAGQTADREPAVMLLGQETSVQALPEPGDGALFDAFSAVAVVGDVVVAAGGAAAPGRTAEPVVYRSTDAGASWAVVDGPGDRPGEVRGVAVLENRFVATGYEYDEATVAQPKAWSSADGQAWTAEELPAVDWDRDGLWIDEGDDAWLGAPAGDEKRIVAPLNISRSLRAGLLVRDAAGAWTVTARTNDWDVPGVEAVVGADDAGSVLLARSTRNAGNVGEFSDAGSWRGGRTVFGTLDDGIRLARFLDLAGDPQLVGDKAVTELREDGGWQNRSEVSRFSLDGTSLADAAVEPEGSEMLTALVAASDPDGRTVVLGSKVFTGSQGESALNLVSWSRAGGQGDWSADARLRSGSADYPTDLTWVDGTWVAVGSSRDKWVVGEPSKAAVWGSTDGITWRRAKGPFAVAGGESTAGAACALPGGDLLVVGYAIVDAQQAPAAWRFSAGTWHRVDAGAFGAAGGRLLSCTTLDGTTVVQGEADERATVWRTEDGETFEAAVVGNRGDEMTAIRAVDGGFAAAGSVSADAQEGAVLWLSEDARTWRAVPLPSDRPLTGADVMADGSGGVLVAANSSSSPEVWRLANPAELFRAAA